MEPAARWTVRSVHRYPVKSMQGETPGSITLETGNVAGDRQWAVADRATGLLLSAKRHGALLEASARTLDGGEVVVRLPSGSDVRAGDPEADAALSRWLEREVELRRPGGPTAGYESLSDAMDESSEVVVFRGPDHHFADFAEVHLLTEASLRAARGLYGGGDWDVRRFRPTVLLAGEGDDFAEDSWVGSVVELGEAAVQVFMPTVRCSLPPRAQPGLPRDMAISRTLRDHHNFSLGVYGVIVHAGTVHAGESVTVIPG